MAKQTITQRDFTLGVLRSGFLEGKDLEARGRSLRGGKNLRIAATRTAQARPGTIYRKTLTTADDVIEVRPATGLVFGIIVNDTSLEVINESMTVVFTQASVAWTDASDVWVEPFRDKTIIGCPAGLYVLTYTAGSWSYGAFAFEAASGGELAQPYWSYNQTVTLTPSAVTGSGITLTASGSLFSSAWVGMRVRYGGREVLITGYTNATTVTGNVVTRLPPSYDVVLASAASFRVGDAVVGQDSNFQGLVISISSNTLKVVTIENFDGPNASEKLSGPSGTSTVSSKTLISPLASPLWDEPLMSPVRGYPGAGSAAAGRLVFCDFPNVPDAIAISSARSIFDFEVGVEDDDAIARQAGDNAPRWLHAVNAGDLLFLSDRGCYLLPLRDNGLLTPSTFNLVLFDKRAAADIKPVQIDGGVVFVEGSGQTIAAALLDGNIYLKWSVRSISSFHSELIRTPKKLCGPPIYSNSDEKFLFVVNSDGTLAALSWYADFGAETVGFVPWDTEGSFINVAPIFGGYWAIVDRQVGGGTRRFMEQFSDTEYLDCAATYVPGGTAHLPDTEVHLFGDGYYGGTTMVNSTGTVIDNGELTPTTQFGYNFVASALMWPVERIETQWAGMKDARLIRFSVSVKDTLHFKVRTNRSTREIEAYSMADDLSLPPPLKTDVYRFVVMGNRAHPEAEVIKDLPGPFHILATTQEVQI